MAAKKIRISDNAGVNIWTFPGNTGDFRRELASVTDTIFGQSFQSMDESIGTWQVTANAIFKGVAGYVCQLRVGGLSTAMTNEATTLVSGKTYQITNAAHRIIDYAMPLVVKDNSVDQTANVLSVDYLSGQVTFLGTYTPVGPVTLTGNYIPTAIMAKSRSFTLTQTGAEIDTSSYDTASVNGGWRTYDPGLRTVKMEIKGVYDATQALGAALASRALMYVDVAPANDVNTLFRGFFKRSNLAHSGQVGALEDTTLSLDLFVPDGPLVAQPFGWYLTGTSTLNTAVQKALAAWQAQTKPTIYYLPDGTTGFQGPAIVTEATLANAYDGLNEFRFSFRGDGAPTAYP